MTMIDPIEFEHEGIKVTVHVAWAGWEYEFDYEGAHYFAHYMYSWGAMQGAKDKINQLKLEHTPS